MRGRSRAIALAAAAALVAAGAAVAAERGALTVSVGGGRHAAAAGIQVHGKWTLVVHGKNGGIVARRHFENSLTSDGATALASLVTGATLSALGGSGGDAAAIGGQELMLDDGSVAGQGCNALVYLDSCAASHSDGDPFGDSSQARGSGNLLVVATGSTVTLSAEFLIPKATTLTKVETLLKECYWHTSGVLNLNAPEAYSPSDCASETESDNGAQYAWHTFTSKTLDTPLAVTAGQRVSASVQLSFS